MFNSDDEKDDAQEEEGEKWRMERFEREKFLSEQKVRESAHLQLFERIGNPVTRKKKQKQKIRCLELVNCLFSKNEEDESGSQVIKLGKAIYKPKKGELIFLTCEKAHLRFARACFVSQ